MDVYAIISKHPENLLNLHIPNSSQYKGVKYREKKVCNASHGVIVHSSVTDHSIYTDDNITAALCGRMRDRTGIIDINQFVELYNASQDQALAKIKGIYSVIIVQKRPLRVISITDPFGLIPPFYYYNNDVLVLSTKLDFVTSNAGSDARAIDYMAVLEQVYFNFILGDKTYFRKIRMQNAGSIIEFDFAKGRISKKERMYWHLSRHMGQVQIPLSAALEKYTQKFSEIVNQDIDNAKSPVVALTGGYDTRTNLAVLGPRSMTIPCFSYGIINSDDIAVPLMIEKHMGIEYFPIYLDEHFADEIVSIAERAIMHSDGLGDLEKANNEYAYGSLGTKYTDVLVGLFGSEFLKAHTFPNRLMPRSILRHFHGFNSHHKEEKDGFLDQSLMHSMTTNVREYLEGHYLSKYKHLSERERLFLFYYYEGARKYFMKELRIGRYYLNILLPYVDTDLLEILFRSKLGITNRGESMLDVLFSRLRSHFVYSHIIKRNMPQLLDIKTNRGYKPKYDLSMSKMLFVLPRYASHRLFGRQTTQYRYEEWARPFAQKYEEILRNCSELKSMFDKNDWCSDTLSSHEMHRLLSLAFFLHHV